MVNEPSDACELLRELGASERLIQHGQLVGEAARLLLVAFRALEVVVDERTVELGALLHDAGKIVYPRELSKAGTLHEEAGERLLRAHGVQAEVARCCRTHGVWDQPGVSLEERLVALADKLWRGKREAGLELLVIDETALRLGASRWEIFERLDTAFEAIASDGAAWVEASRIV
jgi:hypothetical protein